MPSPAIRCAMLAALLTTLVLAGGPGGARAADAVARAKIAPWVIERTAGERAAEFLVVLGEQADLSPAAGLTGRAAKGRFVRDALYAKARATQAPLLAWLQERGVPYRSFYIVNAVLVTGPLDVAEALAARADVARVEGNPELQVVQPIEPSEAELRAAAPAPLGPQAVEPGVAAIRAPEVWATGVTGQGIVIGGADTGVKWDHPALIGHYRGWNGASASHDYNWHDSVHEVTGDCPPDSPVPCDDYGHGTHTLGTAVGADASGTEQIGVAPGARFIGCRNMGEGVGTPARYLECMEWFLAPYPVGGTPVEGDPAMAPDLTTNSWTCPASEGCALATLQAGVEAQRAAGILFVASAGNSGPNCSTVSDPPAIYDAAYTVGAYSSSTGSIASFSSRGPVTADGTGRSKPDITAPGVAVRSAYLNDGYLSMSGTSMASPHVAGAVALLWSAHPTLRGNVNETEAVLNESAVDVASALCGSSGVPNDVFGWGELDAKAAVDLAAVAVSPVAPAAGRVALAPPLPNPAHRSTLLRLRLERDSAVDLAILSSSGRRVRTLLQGAQPAGEHAVRWDGCDASGSVAPPGVYHVRLRVPGETVSAKVIWLGP
jgi:serine protease AprX